MIGIYAIVNKTTGKIYVGKSSCSIEMRKSRHFGDLRRNRHGNPHLQASWNEYGEKDFFFTVLEETGVCRDKNILVKAEQQWMDWSKAQDPDHGYNVVDAKEAPMMGRHHSEKTKAIWKAQKRGQRPRPDVALRNAEKRCKGKLTAEQVNVIRNSGASTQELAAQFEITHQYVSKLRLNQRWKTEG